MASRDVRDIMDLPKGEVVERAPKKKFEKKKKTGHKRGLEKEIAGLQGDREAPIELNIGTQYKAKRKLEGPVRHWAYEPFVNGARTDGLVLHHLKRTNKPAVPARATTDKPADQADEQENADPDTNMEPVQNYAFEKYNIPTRYPQYDDAQYQKHLQSTEWSKDETDYLVRLYADFYGKWPIIWDRYEFQASAPQSLQEETSTPPPEPKVRTMEDLKGRFFEVARKVMTLHTPLTNMTTAEFEDHDKMTKWSAQHERDRKKIAEALLTRNKDEQREEDQLMLELQRIVRDQAKFDEDVRSLRERLDMSLTKDKPDAPLYTTYNQMGQLIQGYMQSDPRKVGRKSTLGSAISSSPVTGSAGAAGAAGTSKKSAEKSGSASNKKLPPQTQIRFGVSMHDRLTSGVTFRTDKIAKLRQAKSGVQTQKIANLLHELQVPELLQTPTVPVFQAMEKLIGQVTALLDARRLREKEEGEIKVVTAQKQEKEKPAADVSMTDATDKQQEKGGDAKPSTEQEKNDDVDMTDAPTEPSQKATQEESTDSAEANGKEEEDGNANGENGEDEDAEGDDEDEENTTAHEGMDVDVEANENTEVQEESEKGEEDDDEDQTFDAENDETNELQVDGDDDYDGVGEAENEGDEDDADDEPNADVDEDGDGEAEGEGEMDDEGAAAEEAAEENGDNEADEYGKGVDASAASTPGAGHSATQSHHGIRGTSVASATSSAGNGTIRVNPKRNKGTKS